MKLGIIATLLCLGLTAVADPTITAVTARQRYPWNGLVDITVTLAGTSNEVAKTECTFVATNNATKTAIPVDHLTCTGTVPANEETTWTRNFIWDATTDVGEVKIEEVALTAIAEWKLGGVQLWKDGPYWAECNVGASKPEEYGYYFWWGDTVGYKLNEYGNRWVSSLDGAPFNFDNCPTENKSLSDLQSLGYIDSTGNLVAAYDAATAHLGTPWRMPTAAEINALLSNCTTMWISTNGVSGCLVIGKGDYAMKNIFLPAAGTASGGGNLVALGNSGYYWSSTRHSDGGGSSCYVDSNAIGQGNNWSRAGESVRPLREFAETTVYDSTMVLLVLDTRMGMREVGGKTERIRFSPIWNTIADGVVVTVYIDATVVTNTTKEGVFTWTPTRNGTYTFTHMVSTNGVQVGETLTATFVVEGMNPETPVISPASRTIFTNASLSVSMTCASEGATIHYTTDGTTPTMESPVYKRFKISGKTTVKAIAFYEDGTASEMAVAEYARGTCEDPVISLADGAIFEHANQVVSIASGAEGVLHYTLDGSEPTTESPVYSGPFTISETTTIKAKVFSDTFFDSQMVTAKLTREWATVATPIVTAAETFTGSETKVEISCVTPGAVIRYTTDGKESNSHAAKYAGPFWVDASCVVKAFATCPDYLSSAVVTQTVTKVWGIGDTMGVPDHAFTTSDGDAAFVRVEDNSSPTGEAMRSGTIGNSASAGTYTQSVLTTTVHGPGTVSFQWRASCEEDDTYEWDHAELAIDGVTVAWINGTTDWQDVSEKIAGAGSHTITWTYLKDDVESEGEDCIWVTDFAWTSAEPYTHTSDAAVPYAWIRAHFPHTPDEYDAYESAVKENAANGHNTVEEAYVAGLSPTDPTSELEATVVLSNGMVYVGWTPNLNTNSVTRIYTLSGRTNLTQGDWETPIQPWHRFFKVAVAMPTGAADETTSVAGKGFVPEDDPAALGGVQLWKDGPYWAECNVGATRPEEYGYYFWWGDTVGYKRDASDTGWVSVKDGGSFAFTESNCLTYGKSKSSLLALGYIDSTGNLVAAHDAATVHLGAPWRMPTSAEIDALVSNCTTTWITTNGAYGRLVKGKGDYASRSIFLPAAGIGNGVNFYRIGSYGHFWSSTPTPRSVYSDCASWYLGFNSSNFGGGDLNRYLGLSIRPLREFAK